MKKLLLAITVLLVLGVCAVYLILPKELVVSHSVSVNTSDKYAFEFLSTKDKWAKWWPNNPASTNKENDTIFNYRTQTFTADGLSYNSVKVNIEKDGTSEKSRINIVDVKIDSAKIEWECKLESGLNPIARIKQYFTAADTRENMMDILASLKSFLDKNENIYGYPLSLEKIKDTLYVSKTTVLNTYPDTKLIIEVLDKLHHYVKLAGGVEAGFPIMNISYLKTGEYQTVIALPVSNPVAETKDFILKRMPKNGNAITTKVTGGVQSIQQALEAVMKYQSDYSLVRPIIPFFSLITDRAKETDSTKWITKIWSPII